MTKTNITIICSTIIPIFVIGIIAVLLWVFRKEVMELWGKLKEKCGEWIGGGKKVVDVKQNVVETESHATNNKAEIRKLVMNYGENREKAADEIHKNNREMHKGNREIRDGLNKISNLVTDVINAFENPQSIIMNSQNVTNNKLSH